MTFKVSAFFIALCACTVLAAQPASYAVDLLPAALKNDAHAVRRYRHIRYDVRSPENIVLQFTEAVTLLNSNAKGHTTLAVFYDKQTKIRSLGATVYDAQGKVTKKYKEKDFRDFAAQDGFSLYLDDRLRLLEVAVPGLPCTVEFTYETDNKGLLTFNTFMAYASTHFAVEEDVYEVKAPTNYGLRYKNVNGAPEPEKLPDGTLRWTYRNLPALPDEILSPPLDALSPTVWVAPNTIAYDGSSGDISTWENLGKWNWALLEGRDKLPAATVEKVRQLVAGTSDTREKVCLIYEYMQQRTRYVSIQLGIGGFQPFTAEEVDKTGYGDCKALSNYTRALLKAVDIPSTYAVIGAGDDRRIRYPDFCSFGQANHVILCVPIKNSDTLWLECTSQRQPCVYQGDFTSNRLALLVDKNGGKLVQTAHYTQEQNRLENTFQFEVKSDGGAAATFQSNGYAAASEDYEALLRYQGKEADDWLALNFPVANAKVLTHRIAGIDSVLAGTRLFSEFTMSRLATVQGQRLFLPVCPLKPLPSPASGGKRMLPMEIRMDKVQTDRFEYRLPAGLKVDFTPEDKFLETPFGTYRRAVRNEGNLLIAERHFAIHPGVYPPEQWSAFIDFLKKVNAADAEKAILLLGP
ncbi:MAG: DUF3857 domain-containing protein [Saprospiraceae bacterium]|nr:DUF3857 domain-containing protein [Saprospiraceae bacterium]